MKGCALPNQLRIAAAPAQGCTSQRRGCGRGKQNLLAACLCRAHGKRPRCRPRADAGMKGRAEPAGRPQPCRMALKKGANLIGLKGHFAHAPLGPHAMEQGAKKRRNSWPGPIRFSAPDGQASQQGAPLARWGRRATAYPRNGGARRAAPRPDQGIRGGFSPCS